MFQQPTRGGTTGDRFVSYIKDTLIPTLNPGDIVVMDNMRSHHVAAVEDALTKAGFKGLYLPAYSPVLNPIEMLWSKVKAILRKWREQSAAMLPQMVHKAISLVTRLDCQAWFLKDGYCPVF